MLEFLAKKPFRVYVREASGEQEAREVYAGLPFKPQAPRTYLLIDSLFWGCKAQHHSPHYWEHLQIARHHLCLRSFLPYSLFFFLLPSYPSNFSFMQMIIFIILKLLLFLLVLFLRQDLFMQS